MDVLSHCLVRPPYLSSVSHYTSRVSGALCGRVRHMEELVEEAPPVRLVDNYCIFSPGFRFWGSALS